jgi:hypothetical protein
VGSSYIGQCSLYIYLSNIDFLVNNNKPSSQYTCARDLLPNDHTFTTGSLFFAGSIFSSIVLGNANTYPSTPVCAYLFKNAQLNSLELDNQVDDSFLFTLLLKFDQASTLNDTNNTINSNISNYCVDGYNYKLDTSVVVHPLVFKATRQLLPTGTIASIQPDLFATFLNLTSISFNLDSVGNFYHKVGGIEWMLSLPPTGIQLTVTCPTCLRLSPCRTPIRTRTCACSPRFHKTGQSTSWQYPVSMHSLDSIARARSSGLAATFIKTRSLIRRACTQRAHSVA